MAKEVRTALITGIFALVGIVLTWFLTDLSNQHERDRLKAQRAQITSPEGIYLWQVAGDANGDPWAGYINVDDQGNPNIQMWRMAKCHDNQIVRLRLLQQDQGHAEVTTREPGKLHIHIPVRFIKYDNTCQTPTEGQPLNLEPQQILEGDIDQTIGYAGSIRYIKPTGEQPFGVMNLVKSTPGFVAQ
ncbi:MAG TPA: hypothetical protein VI685_20070 [Candidatus Angelobacter sp.]